MATVSQRVLVSRQLEDAEPLTQALVRGGYEPLVIPAIQIVVRGACPATRAALLSAGVLALPSRSAAKFLRQFIPSPQLSVFAQGPRTAQALGSGWEVTCADGLYGADLARCIHERAPGAPVTVLAGDKTQGAVADELTRLGHSVRVMTVYQNRSPGDLTRPPCALKAAIYFSPSAVERQLEANPWLQSVPSIAIGRTTAAALRSGDCSQIICARGPEIESILAELEKV